jgi:hypothetical protein
MSSRRTSSGQRDRLQLKQSAASADAQRSGLQSKEDMQFQRREWFVQRLGWVALVLITLAALAGVFGRGPASQTLAESGPLKLEYERFWRLMSPTQLKVRLAPEATQAKEVRLLVAQEYLDSVSVEHVTPQPQSVQAGAAHAIYTFAISEPGRETTVIFTIEPQEFGKLSGRVSLPDQTAIDFYQFVYP